MKIVNRETFLKLPANTLFSKYEPQFFYEIGIKCDTTSDDYFCSEIVDAADCTSSDDMRDKLEDAEENGTELAMCFDTQGRDGMFDQDQLFAVWSTKDVEQLIVRLKECL